MSKWEKTLAKIKNNPKHVRFQDIEKILLLLGFEKRQDKTSHATFSRGLHRLTVPKPHGSPFVKEIYIKKLLLPMLEEIGMSNIEEE